MSQAPFCPWEPQPVQQGNGHAVPQYQQPTYYVGPPPPLEEIILRECEICKTYMQLGEKTFELYGGIEGRSPQTGFPMTVDPPGQELEVFKVHRKCLVDLTFHLCPDEVDELISEIAEERAAEMFQEWQQNTDSMDDELDRRLEDERA